MNENGKKVRIVKEYDERKKEITDTAAKIFYEKGYEKCSVNEIITTVGIAKGTFYHYFKTKEEVLDAVIDKFTLMIRKKSEEIVGNSRLSPQEKLISIFLSMNIEKDIGDHFLSDMHKPENALMHQKTLVSVMEALLPLLVKVVEEGIEKGVFSCPYPKQYMQIFLSSVVIFTDEGIFNIKPEEKKEFLIGTVSLLENMLSTKKGEFFSIVENNF